MKIEVEKIHKKEYPKILIISETFKMNSGGGITLSNLFRGYPKECLANAIDSSYIPMIENDEICDNFYSIGAKEKKNIFTSIFFNGKAFSGKYKYRNSDTITLNKQTNNTFIIKQKLYKFLINCINFLGVNHFLYRYTLSTEFKKWITDFNPDIIYSQLASREMMQLTNKLKDFTSAKLAIHIMDDWTKFIGNNGIFSFFWNPVIENEFKKTLDRADILLSISEGMSEEYKIRYRKDFTSFHNPIDTDIWYSQKKINYNINPQNVNILYSGRIGLGIDKSLIFIAKTIKEINKENNFKINFIIQTSYINNTTIDTLKEFTFVKINPVAQYNELPNIFSSADLLIMPIDFKKKTTNFLKLSMPTKASEFMISGTPIILFCDKELALYKHAEKYKWAKLVPEQSLKRLKYEIITLLEDKTKREELGNIATNLSLNQFDSKKIRNSFKQVFIESLNKNKRLSS